MYKRPSNISRKLTKLVKTKETDEILSPTIISSTSIITLQLLTLRLISLNFLPSQNQLTNFKNPPKIILPVNFPKITQLHQKILAAQLGGRYTALDTRFNIQSLASRVAVFIQALISQTNNKVTQPTTPTTKLKDN